MDTKTQSHVQEVITKLRRRTLSGSFAVARETASILRQVVQASKWSTFDELVALIRDVGRSLVMANPSELSSGNIARRVLYIAREEWNQLVLSSKSTAVDLPEEKARESTLLTRSISLPLGESPPEPLPPRDDVHHELKPAVVGSIGELMDELSNLYKNIADQAIEHIHANEVILTLGRSRTVENFLRAAARKRSFSVFVAEGAPKYFGHNLASTLARNHIDTTLVSDADVFALMSRVNKVIVSTHAVLANGGLIAPAGTHQVALAAMAHNVPVVVTTGLYKLCPLFATDQDMANFLSSPAEVLPFQDAERIEHVHVDNPSFDYVPPELISLYLTNFGGFNPDYIYRLIQEYYTTEDGLDL